MRVTDDAIHSAAAWSIVAVDADTGEVGVAGAACSRAVEMTGGVAPGLGAIAAQGGPNARGRSHGLRLLAEGASPKEVIEAVANSDYDWLGRLDLYESRQYGVAALGFEDAAAAFTGARVPGPKADAQGRGVSVQGNRLATRAVVDAALAAFQAGMADCRRDLADDLMVALEAGAARGGDVRCPAQQAALSAFITVARPDDTRRDVTLRLLVPAQERGGANAVALLRRKFDAWRLRHPAQRRCAAEGD
jgi:uncharacterized Ntn-hydrolase superfamily protein